MPVQTEVVGRTWGTLAFPLSLSHQNCSFFWLLSPMKQIEPAGSVDLSCRFPEQERNHATMQQLESMCLPIPTNPPAALQIEEALPQPVPLHLMSIVTQHLSITVSGYRHCFCIITHNWTHQIGSHPALPKTSSQPGQGLPAVLGQWRRRHLKSRLGFGGFVSSLKKRLFKIIPRYNPRWSQLWEKCYFKM